MFSQTVEQYSSLRRRRDSGRPVPPIDHHPDRKRQNDKTGERRGQDHGSEEPRAPMSLSWQPLGQILPDPLFKTGAGFGDHVMLQGAEGVFESSKTRSALRAVA